MRRTERGFRFDPLPAAALRVDRLSAVCDFDVDIFGGIEGVVGFTLFKRTVSFLIFLHEIGVFSLPLCTVVGGRIGAALFMDLFAQFIDAFCVLGDLLPGLFGVRFAAKREFRQESIFLTAATPDLEARIVTDIRLSVVICLQLLQLGFHLRDRRSLSRWSFFAIASSTPESLPVVSSSLMPRSP